MKVDEVFTISDGNGGTVQAKVTDVDPYWVHYRIRKGNHGSFAKQVHDASRRKFKELITSAA